ncbi:hypothetical protein [Mycolicibacterium mengxianglii]|uniref:hypothetical protein n=1 Tax=Mycolicibacterium mengxianglii TaxID=2736649 RepID=UPI0018EF081A|nr:hypothetical protein [Mycolicibacterium mengxianglii]
MTAATTTSADLAVPPGADADTWVCKTRDIYQAIGTVLASDDIMKCPLVTAMARQRLDGQLEQFFVEVDDAGRQPLSAVQARELAAYLIEAATVIDGWASL